MEKFFKLKEHGTDFKTEILAGITTFMTMAYILAVNPAILKDAGMDQGAVFTATAVASFIGTVCMAILANMPFAMAPGMGLNAFFTYSVVIGMGASFEFALTAVFLEGLIFIILTVSSIREAIVNAIPLNLKRAISVGIGLFIAFIGLLNAGIIIPGEGVPLALGDITGANVIVAVIGLIVTSVLIIKNVKSSILIGILVSTIAGVLLNVASLPKSPISLPPSLSPIFFKFEWDKVFTLDMLVVMVTFLFVDMFDTIGTLVGVCTKANMLDKDGQVPNVRPALLSDAIGTVAGSVLGTSTVTTYVESASGVAAGGRTGLTALSTGIMFLIALVFSPIFLSIPSSATAPALIIVGLYMMAPIKEINFEDWTEAFPAFLTIIMMPLAYSIAQGVVFGIISYAVLKIISGRFKEATPMLYILAILFIIKLAFGL